MNSHTHVRGECTQGHQRVGEGQELHVRQAAGRPRAGQRVRGRLHRHLAVGAAGEIEILPVFATGFNFNPLGWDLIKPVSTLNFTILTLPPLTPLCPKSPVAAKASPGSPLPRTPATGTALTPPV